MAAPLFLSFAGTAIAQSHAPQSRSDAAQQQFARATAMRQDLEGRPQGDRTKLDYGQVLDAYRTVYHGDPASSKAPDAITAVAELMAEEGRLFAEQKPLQDAIGQYEFLRKQYPGSALRIKGTLVEAEILDKDLNDPAQAHALLQDFLRSYPHSELAPQARRQLAGLYIAPQRNAPALATPVLSMKDAPHMRSSPTSAAIGQNVTAGVTNSAAQLEPPHTRQPAQSATVTPLPPPAPENEARAIYASGKEPPATVLTEVSAQQTPPARKGRAMVTEIRHWSTPNYTRVAIDLEGEVRYQASRVPNPDRIYFDLYNTRLAPQLMGHLISVEGDAFLKDIRAAQYTQEITRVVLDVSSVAEYSAFLLPNPYRLIIDVHGRKPGTESASKPSAPTRGPGIDTDISPSAATNLPATNSPSRTSPSATQPASRTPPAAASQKNKSAAPPIDPNARDTGIAVPPPDNTTTSPDEDTPPATHTPQNLINKRAPAKPRRDSPANDIATLEQQPQTVRATRHPTTQPVVDAVAPPREDATDTRPFAKSVIPGAESKSAASTDSAVAKSSTAQPPATLAATDPASPPPKVKRKRGRKVAVDPATQSAPDPQQLQVHEAEPTASGERSLVRALGLKIGRIVIDPGHGGHDAGTVGPDGIEEKDVVLDVGLRLGKLLRQRLGADVTFTRSTDVFIPLETRTAIANKAQADLFVSIHANSSRDPTARGVETYYLNFTASPDALDVAARENAVSEKSIHELQDLVKKITLKDKIDESREFAGDVEHSLYQGIGQQSAAMKDRGVKKAPFVVLIGANMPSILTEISFVSNPDDARELHDGAYREKIAESLYSGIARYINGLSSVRVAQASGN